MVMTMKMFSLPSRRLLCTYAGFKLITSFRPGSISERMAVIGFTGPATSILSFVEKDKIFSIFFFSHPLARKLSPIPGARLRNKNLSNYEANGKKR